jgi:hypothetical protein
MRAITIHLKQGKESVNSYFGGEIPWKMITWETQKVGIGDIKMDQGKM